MLRSSVHPRETGRLAESIPSCDSGASIAEIDCFLNGTVAAASESSS
jgi:hypothetical protein